MAQTGYWLTALSCSGRNQPMDRKEITEILQPAIPELKERYDVLHLDLFGSFARGDAKPDSDVDFVVTFAGAPTFSRFMGLKEDLEALLMRDVDLVTSTGLRPRIRKAVLAERYPVA